MCNAGHYIESHGFSLVKVVKYRSSNVSDGRGGGAGIWVGFIRTFCIKGLPWLRMISET